MVKVETVNPIRSFKGRGTWQAIGGLAGEGVLGPDRPLVVASTGNFGQGVAYAGRALGVPVTVFADEHANPLKVAPDARARGDRDRRGPRLRRRAGGLRGATPRASGAQLLVDGEDPRIATGAATLALELTDAVDAGVLPRLGSRLCPGRQRRADRRRRRLACGTRPPGCRVVGVQSERRRR